MKRYTRKEAFANALVGAKAGNPDYQNFAGYCYDTGSGVAKDPKKAVYWYSVAARNKNIHGIFNFALALNSGHGIRRNPMRAVKLYIQAAERGDLQSQTNLAAMLLDDDGVKYDPVIGMKWMRRASKRGDSKAQYNLGRAYAKGEDGLQRNLRSAKFWLSKAADDGHHRAHRLLSALNRQP